MNPSRLSLARRKRGLTKKRLAEECGFGTRTITAYESGQLAPSEDAIGRLAAALAFPVSFFGGEDLDEPPVDGSTFRSLSRMTARQRDSALASGALGFHVAAWIEQRFNLPEPDIPDLGALSEPEKAAEALRVEWGLGWGPIRSMVRLLESKGVFVMSLSGLAREIDAFSTWNGQRPFVFLNPTKTAERSRMDCAHELAHLILHRHRSVRHRDVEHEAKIFGSSFLMPRDGVVPTARRGPSLNSVISDKARWGASALAYVVRLHRLGLVTDWHYRRLCIFLRRWGDSEPNPMQREGSELVSKVLAALRREGLSRAALARELSISAADLESLFHGLVMTVVSGGGSGGGARTTKGTLRLVR